jgi:hypothetical protein
MEIVCARKAFSADVKSGRQAIWNSTYDPRRVDAHYDPPGLEDVRQLKKLKLRTFRVTGFTHVSLKKPRFRIDEDSNDTGIRHGALVPERSS